jgi:hypothetical protein
MLHCLRAPPQTGPHCDPTPSKSPDQQPKHARAWAQIPGSVADTEQALGRGTLGSALDNNRLARAPRGAGSVTGGSKSCGVMDASIDPSR